MHQKMYRENTSFETRKELSQNLKRKYIDRIPVIFEPQNIEAKKTKYIIHKDKQFSSLVCAFRENNKEVIKMFEGLFFFVNGVLPANSCTIGSLYNIDTDNDGFLYISVRKENTFG